MSEYNIEYYRQLAELAYEDTNKIKKFQSGTADHGINEPERFDNILEVIKDYEIDGRNDSPEHPTKGADVTTFYKDDQLIIAYRKVLPDCLKPYGGALATISALDLSKKSTETNENITILNYTFGSPKVGNHVFKELYEKSMKEGTTFRIADPYDIVTKCPPDWLSWAFKKTFWFAFPETREDKYVHVPGKNYSTIQDIRRHYRIENAYYYFSPISFNKHILASYKTFVDEYFTANKRDYI